MVAEIRWSDKATGDYESIVEYLLKYWETGIASRFIDVVNHKVKQLSLHPEIFSFFAIAVNQILSLASLTISETSKIASLFFFDQRYLLQ